ncbi:MAG TPA: SAM-dependent methyltransferase [Actinophytocola sp.]|uniref:SAM-dependent methyltransferase n=1 Tax=Actinophytocola sp. TaxID=1872138 RepID=UPI002DDD4A9B|nr:SAM-dependent methyltransferase [Actinophytocola sp.]HEV2778354.1 SAM-dependent methyltransferase [Actinophytocola sp.]
MTGYLRWVPPRIDMSVAHPARMHDYWLGGGRNFAADRELAEKIIRMMPGVEDVARLNQAFLRRAALFMVEQGIRQFLDIGSGIPTVGNLHEIVRRAAPECRVVYVDGDPVAVAHTELLLEDVGGTAVLLASLRDIPGVLDAEATRELLDLDAPIGLIAPMLHFIPDAADPACILAGYRDRLASGSYMAIAHGTADTEVPGLAEVIEAYRSTHHPVYPRTHAEILRMCAGFDLVEPGLVGFAHWRPEDPADLSPYPGINSMFYAAVGRKP